MIRWLLFVCALLAGCATLAPPPPARLSGAEITAFAFVGRLAVRQGDVRHHVNVDWRHDGPQDAVLLTTPLGQGIAEIVRDAAGARLTLADQRRFEAADWSDLSQQVFGFPLPLDASARWLLGDASALADWRIRVVERESSAPGALPTVIELERGDIALRLRIDEWTEVK